MGAVPTLERTDSVGVGAGELGVEWNSLAGAAGAAVQSGTGTAGLSCPAGMVLDGDLCKTPVTESVEADRVCAQDGYELVVGLGEQGVSHSCQKTVAAYCTGGKVLHEGQCRTRTTEQRDAKWSCSEGTLETTFLDPGYAYSCKVAVSPPQCPDGQSYRTSPAVGCYEEVSFRETQDYTWSCSAGALVSTFLDPGYSYSCKIALAAPACPEGETYRNDRCETEEDFFATRGYEWKCSVGTKTATSGEHGTAYSCRIALSPPTCPEGETYRNDRCETQEDYYPTRGYEWKCSQGVRVVTSGEHGTSYSCKIAVSPPTCPAGETYRNDRCEEQQTYYRTRGYEWKCSQGVRVVTSGEHGTSYSCRIALSPPTCPNGETFRNNRCETQQTYYDSRPYRYTCASGYTLKTTTVPPTCTKTETYRKKVCSYDPFAGQQCWWESRTRTLTEPAAQTCPSGYSPDGAGCTADRASKRWVRTASTPTRHRYVPAVRSCIAGYSPAGSVCQSDTASTRWVKTASAPIRHRYEPAAKSCLSGYSDNGVQCQADKASTRWAETASVPKTHRYVPAARSCVSGYSDNGVQCQADEASTRWVPSASTPATHRYVPAAKSCPAGWSDNGAECESDTASTRWDRTSSAPVTSRTAAAVRSCDAGFAWNDTAGKCHKTTYSDPTGPLTRLVGDPPQVSCRDGYGPAGGGRCTRTTLGEPTAVPTGAGCISDLGTLAAGSISRSGTLGAGCTSLRKGDAQSPHWARRFSLRVAAASTATFTASSSAADVFIYVLTGSGTDVVEVASDDDSGTGTDAAVTGVALAPGVTYTVEVTTAAANVAGAFTLAAAIAAVEPPVAISGLADTTTTGIGTVAVAAAFTVDPAAAACTATADTAGVKPTVAVGPAAHQRTVTVTAAAPFSHTVTVTCDAAGRTATTAAVTLAAAAQQVRIGGLDDSVPSGTTRPGGVAYAVDVFTVEPAAARCVGTADGRGAAAPQVSTRSGTRTAVVRLSPGGAALVTITCTAPGYSPGVARALFSWAPRPQIGAVTAAFAPSDACTAVPPSQRDGADAAYRCTLDRDAELTATLTVIADHATITTAWDTDSAVTAVPTPATAPTPVIGPDNAATGDWQATAAATLGCTAHGTATATLTAGVHPATDTHTTAVHIDCQPPVRIDGLDDAAGHGSTGAAVTVAEEFTVTPADAECAAAPVGAVTAPDPARPQHRLLSAEVTAGAAVTVTVACTAGGYADSSQDVELSGVAADCDDPLGSVIHGVTVRDGTIAADAGCVSAGRGLGGTFYARRHTFTLDAAARVTVDVSGEAGVDAYVVLYRGHDATAEAVLRRDDNSGPSSDPRLRGVRLAAGDYAVEATTAQAQATGGYRVTLRAAYGSPVRISGLADAVGAGTGAVTVTEPFTVTPAAAACTASPPAASVAAAGGRRRAVSATLDGPGSLRVTVTCTAARRGPAAADLTLTHAGALTSIAARITAGGGECTATRAPRRFDAAYRCTIGRGNTVTVAADTAATGPTLHTAWAATGGISLASPAQRGAVPLFAPDNTVAGWQRTATVELECTANGTATATASLPGTTASKTARLTITCADAVQIDGLADTTANATGTLTVTRTFTVTPADAACTADPTTATVTAGAASARTLSARVAVPGTLDVTVTCKAAGHADGVRQVALTAARPCSTHLGALATGTVTRSGTVADDGCVAQARLPRTATVFYAARRAHWAKRHTFVLKTPGWVTVSIDNAPANAEPLDTYAVLLKDDNNKGTVIARNDNRSRRRTDARLTDLFLQPGSYTIEATTKQPRTAGSYDITVEAVVSGLADSYTATVGTPKTITFRYWPPDAQIAVKTAAAEEFGLTVTTRSAAGDGYGTAAIALTPRLVHDHELTVRVSSRSAAGQLISFKLTARCPAAPPVPGGPTLTTSTHNEVLCVKTGTSDPRADGQEQQHRWLVSRHSRHTQRRPRIRPGCHCSPPRPAPVRTHPQQAGRVHALHRIPGGSGGVRGAARSVALADGAFAQRCRQEWTAEEL